MNPQEVIGQLYLQLEEARQGRDQLARMLQQLKSGAIALEDIDVVETPVAVGANGATRPEPEDQE